MAGLTPKQQRFVSEYLLDLNATAAARRASYKDPNKGRQLVTKSNVAAAIAAAQAARAARVQVQADDVLRELARLALSDLGQVLDFSGEQPKLRPANEIPESARRTLAAVKVRRRQAGPGPAAREVEVIEFKLWSKLEALGQLGRHLGLFVERHEVAGALTLEVVERVVRTREEARRGAADSGANGVPPAP